MEQIENEDKLLSASAYLFFIPSLFIILTDKRKVDFNAFHAAQALLVWLAFIAVMVLFRVLLGYIWPSVYFPLVYFKRLISLAFGGYMLYCAGKAIYGDQYSIPYFTDLARRFL